ncbi:MAG: PDDEXK nuclease domain-containing protein [Pseudomonadota bacterium]
MSKDTTTPPLQEPEAQNLYGSIRELIQLARRQVATQVNHMLVLTYWRIGKLIKTEISQDDRSNYGEGTLKVLAAKLTLEFGNGFTYTSLTRMAKFYIAVNDEHIVATLSQQLNWSHMVEIIKLEDELKRDFYIALCSEGRWSVRVLRERIESMLYERTAIAKRPDLVVRQELAQLQQQPEHATPNLFLKDPYLLDFLNLPQGFSEKNLESAILEELEHFILELGNDFAFMARQKRLQIGGNDYYVDLLFYHRKLRRLVLIELKLGSFKAEYKGQVELYLNWLAKYEQQPDENPPIAIILCSGKELEEIELLGLEKGDIHVAEYWLKLPPKAVLQAKLHQAIQDAHLKLDLNQSDPI